MHLLVFVLAPIVGILTVFGSLRWALASHEKERAPWLELLAKPASDATEGTAATLEGIVQPSESALTASFSGRECLAYTLEIIVQEQLGNSTTWTRAFASGEGRVALATAEGTPTGEAVLDGARPLFPPELTSYNAFSGSVDIVFQGAPEAIPEPLAAFVNGLAPETRDLVWRPSGQLVGGKRVFFNERVVVGGSRLVVIGPVLREEGALLVAATEERDVFVGFGTRATERARLAKLPIGGELFGAIVAGIIASALVAMIAGMLSPKNEPEAPTPGPAVSAEAPASPK